MKIYCTVSDYIPEAKKGDFIVLGGMGIMDGIKNIRSKHDVYKVVQVDSDICFKQYRGKNQFRTNQKLQQIALLSKAEFNKLPTIY
jgi:hypothetical protein